MQTNHKPDHPRLRRLWTLDLWMFLAGSALVIYFRPFAQLFPGLEAYESIHRSTWLEIAIYATAWALVKTIYLWGFRRGEQRRDFAAIKEDIETGRMKRISFAARWIFILFMLALVSLGWFGAHVLTIAVPLFLLFVAMELNIIIHPGDSVLPNPSDELLLFFKARMLQAGYITAISALVTLYLVYLFAPGYVGLLLPIVMVLCLLVPGLVYRHLDDRAATDG